MRPLGRESPSQRTLTPADDAPALLVVEEVEEEELLPVGDGAAVATAEEQRVRSRYSVEWEFLPGWNFTVKRLLLRRKELHRVGEAPGRVARG